MPKTYAQISKELQALQVEAEKIKKEEVAEVVRKIKEAIDTYGLSDQDLFGRRGAVKAAGKKSAKRSSGAPKYADGNGNVWGGMGPRPKWLRDALTGGKQLEDFLNDRSGSSPSSEQGSQADAGAASEGEPSSPATASKKAGSKKAAAKKSPRASTAYTDGTQSWSGMGPRPGWLKKAIAAGRSLEEFRAQ